MSDEARPARKRRLQVHLSTAVVMMVVAGALIWANVRVRNGVTMGEVVDSSSSPFIIAETTESLFLNGTAGESWYSSRVANFGWPFDAMETIAPVYVKRPGRVVYIQKSFPQINHTFKHVRPYSTEWHSKAVVENAVAALAILFTVWFVCEWWIRRRAARKET